MKINTFTYSIYLQSNHSFGVLPDLLAAGLIHDLLHAERARERRQLSVHHHGRVGPHLHRHTRTAVLLVLHNRQSGEQEIFDGSV